MNEFELHVCILLYHISLDQNFAGFTFHKNIFKTTPNQYHQKYPFPCTESQGMFICLRIFVQRFLCCQYTFEVSTELGMYLQCNYLYWCINSTFHSPKMELAKLLYNDINLYLSRQSELLNSKLQDQKEKLPLPKLYKKVAPKAFSFTIAMMTDDVS